MYSYVSVYGYRILKFISFMINLMMMMMMKMRTMMITVYFYCDLQEYRVYAYFHQHWTDKRLAGKLNRTITIKGGDIENIWVPDPYCYNARESNMMMPDEETHSNVKINSSGKITYSRG